MTDTAERLDPRARPVERPSPVLIIEDSATDRLLLRETLVDEGWAREELTLVPTLSDAREALLTRSYAALLLDLTLPDASGLTAVAVMAAAAPEVPIVVVSAQPGDSLVMAALGEGADEFISKHDLSGEAIVESLSRAVRQRRHREGPSTAFAGPAFDDLASAAAVLDGTGRIVAVNQAWYGAADTGGAPRHAVGPGVNYLVACDAAVGEWSDGAAEAAAGIRDVLTGRSSSFTLDYPCPDGARERWFSMRVTPLGAEGGGAVVTHLDVTAFKLAELHLRREGHRLAGVFDESLPIFAVLDADAVVREVSPSTRHLLGLSAGAVVGASAFERIAPEDVAAAARTFAAVMAEPGVSHRVQLRALDGHGRWRDLDVSAVNLLDHERVRGIVVTGSDLTAARHAQIAGRLESRLLQRLPAAVVVTDERDVIVYWNARAEEMFGFSAAEALGRDARTLAIGPERREEAMAVVAEVMAGRRWEGAYDARRADGSLLPIYTTLELVTDPEIGFRGVVGASVDITERRRLEADLAFASLHDPLTGLPNRRLLVDHLESSVARSARSAGSTAVHSIDLDEFKAINDVVGPAIGDAILRTIAERLTAVVRQGDLVARLGGDEFVICSENVASAADALALGHRILEVLAQPILVEGAAPVTVSASIGVALSSPGGHAEVLIRNATAAMATAKEAGRHRVEIFDDELHAQASRRHHLALELAHGLEHDQLEVHFQPEIAVATGDLAGFEALVRWRHPERGLVPPDEFIGVAEESGLIVALGDRVLSEACQQLSRWLELGPEAPLWVAVNVSARQLSDPEFPSRVRAIIAAHQVPPARVCLEVTESALLDTDAAERALRALKEIGVTIAIDDFGTGYSSLSRLKRFRVDFLKIDRGFVSGIGVDPEDDVIVAAVVNLASSLGLRVVAEGIETPEQLDRLADLGCEFGQGYLWHRPAEAETAAALVTSRSRGWQVAASGRGDIDDGEAAPIDARAAVGLLAHELAAPLTALAGYAELMIATDDPEIRAKAAQVIDRNARLARSALSLVVDVTSVEEGTLRLEREHVALGSIVEDALSLTAARAGGDLPITVDIDETLLWCDPDRLVEVLGNLIGNAVKYSPPGTPIRVWSEQPDPSRLALHVTDAGPGIPSHRVGVIFRKFGRADRYTHGTGLGLFLARGIARAHGGDLVYRQAPGGGADFVLDLPVTAAAEDLD